MMPLKTLLKRLDEAGLVVKKQGRLDRHTIDHLASDSRKVGPDGLFVAIRGDKSDGRLFIDKAVQNGAVAIVHEAAAGETRERHPDAAFVQVTNARGALAELAAAFYGDPSRALKLIGVTGTNGKTTTTYLLYHVLTALGQTTGLIGTIEVRLGGPPVAAKLTTPDALDLAKMMRRMVDAGCTACAMEVSSHALDQERARALAFDVGIFTNLTRDHLDYHGSLENYLLAKKRLFDGLSEDAAALYNADDPAGPQMIVDTRARVISYGRSETADLRVQVLENRLDGLRLKLDGYERKCRLVGLFNAYNLAAAYGAARALGFSAPEVLEALAEAPPVPGRFEQIPFPDGTTVIVDYAHTPDALENVLLTVRETKPEAATLWCVFGCGGDRDPSKRRFMGSIAEHYADRVIVTSDNPRTEDPEAIMNDIRRGMSRPGEAVWLVGRRDALAWAAAHAAPGDVVLIAGKGHEAYQIIGTRTLPFDDREEAMRLFGRRAFPQEKSNHE